MFKKAHNFNIERIEVSGQNADPLNALCDAMAAGALLNSDERSDAPKCHPETRVAVQQDIFGWVKDNDCREAAQPKKMLLLSGPAGSGKTTIMNTIGEELRKSGNLAAAFFFSSFTGSVERSTKGRFVTTLAYQLVQHDCLKDVTERILSSISKNPAIFRMHLREEMEVLILEPLRSRQRDPCSTSHLPEILLVDGLDECGQIPPDNCDQAERNASRVSRERDQTEILQVLLDALKDPAFPFRLIIASRPEPAIMQFFSESAKDHSVEIFLDNKYNPDADIKLYLSSHFSRIRRKHTYLSPSWPGEEAIATLVDNASGQMIYAATIIRFVETPTNSPGVQLDFVLESDMGRGKNLLNPFEPLDALYAKILNSSPDPMLALKWLKTHLFCEKKGRRITRSVIRLCESFKGEKEHLFANMAALIRIESGGIFPEYSDVRFFFHHKSFQDFLGDALRHRAFFTLEEEDINYWILSRLVEVMERKGPAVPAAPAVDASDFINDVTKLWCYMTEERSSLTECDRVVGLEIPFIATMFAVSHNKCLPFLLCRRDCGRWRKPLLARWKQTYVSNFLPPRRFNIFLDRFGIKRIRPGPKSS